VAELLIATTNPGKVREIRGILNGLPSVLKTLDDYPGIPQAEETGASFAENARQKARHYAELTGALTLAEDSGFEVDALDGEPGIYSARYLREDATYEERFADIYRRIRERGMSSSGARFVCSAAIAQGTDILFETTAVVEGMVALVPAGTNGFGYDPVFYYSPYGRTFGEVSDAEKTAVSHRGQAIRAIRDFLSR
jgi:XTP/dITP diphosphohydrolase